MSAGHWVEHTAHGKTGWVQYQNRESISAALFGGEGCEAARVGGRGGAQRFHYGDGSGIVRPCRRGGLVRRLIRDSYVFVNRPRREWLAHVFLFERGLRVPEPLGVYWERRGICFRGAVSTREIDGAATLAEYVAKSDDSRKATLEQVGTLVRMMHDFGVFHGDLQVGNILVGPDSPYLIDFGNARRYARLSPLQRARDLLRFRRSLVKNGIARDVYDSICGGYGGFRPPAWLSWGYRLKGTLSDWIAGRSGTQA